MSVLVATPCSESTINELGIKNCSKWTCDLSYFDGTYKKKETCFLLEGEVTVTFNVGETVIFEEDYLFVLSAGMKCRGYVNKALRKHYRFGD